MAISSRKSGKHTPLRRSPTEGTHVVWPRGVCERYDISAVTLWRWERAGRLPPRDIEIGGRKGWKPGTLAAAEAGRAA